MSFMSEFKEFINRGNVMDMAVGVIVGGAFTAIVTSLTDNIINPLITLITGGGDASDQLAGLKIAVGGEEYIDFGAFISAVINFLIIALIVFCIVKGFNSMRNAGDRLRHKQKEEEVPAPTCPFCLEEVKEGATRCPHCGGAFEEPAAPGKN
ncbi:MAG: large conductance mechanosensitive channel protein MscL [Coriobacteriales bacterium]|jgi:large conductance mechanosensitive channel